MRSRSATVRLHLRAGDLGVGMQLTAQRHKLAHVLADHPVDLGCQIRRHRGRGHRRRPSGCPPLLSRVACTTAPLGHSQVPGRAQVMTTSAPRATLEA
jgi:hypothetical protein